MLELLREEDLWGWICGTGDTHLLQVTQGQGSELGRAQGFPDVQALWLL